MCFFIVLEGAAREYIVLHNKKEIQFPKIADVMVNHYQSASAQRKLQAESDGISLMTFMKRNESVICAKN